VSWYWLFGEVLSQCGPDELEALVRARELAEPENSSPAPEEDLPDGADGHYQTEAVDRDPAHTARLAEGGWKGSWLLSRILSQEDTRVAMIIAETTASWLWRVAGSFTVGSASAAIL